HLEQLPVAQPACGDRVELDREAARATLATHVQLDQRPIAHFLREPRLEPQVVDDFLEQVDVAPHALVAQVIVRLGGHARRHDAGEPESRPARAAATSRNGTVPKATARRPGRGLFVVGLVALVTGVALAATSLIGNGNSAKKTATPAALPAFSKSPLTPRKG